MVNEIIREKVVGELNQYAYEKWHGDLSYCISEDGVISEYYADGDFGMCHIDTGKNISMYASDKELLDFFNNDKKLVEIVKDNRHPIVEDIYEEDMDDEEAFMHWINHR